MLPKIVTSAIAYVASSSLPSVAPIIALIAETPQIEYPVAVKSPSPGDTPNLRAMNCVPKNVVVATITTAMIPRPPRSATCRKDN